MATGLFAVGECVSPLAAVSLAFGAAALAGLDGRAPFHVGPLIASAWALLAATAGAVDVRWQQTGSNRGFTALLALSVGLLATIASLLVLIAVQPCGSQCL